MERIVLAYSGGLETSAAISWLAGKYRAEVVTLTLDLGQSPGLDDVRERALAAGAVRAHVLDAREEFARDFVLPALQAGAMAGDRDLLATPLTRPLIARKLVEIAHIEGAKAVAHAERHLAALDRSLHVLDPALEVIALARTWGLSPAELIHYAKQRGIPVSASVDRSYRTDVNLWGRTIECGLLIDPSQEVPEDVYERTKPPAEAAEQPAYVELEFERGRPITLNGIAMSLVELIQCLDTIAGEQAIGRGDCVTTGVAGGASRQAFESPSAAALHVAHADLQHFVTPPDLHRLSVELSAKYADLVREGRWDSPTREAIDALVANVQQKVTGTVRLKLFKGRCDVAGRTAHGDKADSKRQKSEGRRQKTSELASR